MRIAHYLSNIVYDMKSLSKDQFREYVVRKAKEYILSEGLVDSSTDILKESDSITPNSVKEFVSDLKRTSNSLTFQEPLIESKVKSVQEEPGRRFHVGTYENTGIELKDTLMETMYNYNRQKSLSHGKDDATTAWERLVDYKKFEEEK